MVKYHIPLNEMILKNIFFSGGLYSLIKEIIYAMKVLDSPLQAAFTPGSSAREFVAQRSQTSEQVESINEVTLSPSYTSTAT